MNVSAILNAMALLSSEADAGAPPTLTPREAAERLFVSDGTIRRRARCGQLEGVRVGGRLRIDADAVERFAQPAAEGEA